jgi:pimeloyl-ACP methyl ester carboxylesterase
MNGTHFYYKHHPERIMVIYHGNAGNACDRAYLAEWLTQADWGYLLVAYSGYSDDTGRPTHNRIRTDVKNITTYLQTTEVQTIAVLGESLGAAVAGIHATLLPPDALLLITPFDSLARIARHHYWYLPTFLVTNGVYDTMAALENYNGRVMIIHGTNDMVIPISHAQNLYEIIPTKEKYFISVAGASHNDLWSFPVARAALEQFLQE